MYLVFIIGKSPRIGTFTAVKLLNSPLASCSFRNLAFLLLHTADFDKSIIRLFLVLATIIFSTLQTINKHCFIYSLNFYLSLEFLISSNIS